MRIQIRPEIIILATILITGLTACSNRHPAYSEYDYALPMVVRPADSTLAGEYELDEFSYRLVDGTKAYSNTPILLTLYSNRTLQLTNLPDMALNAKGQPVKGQLINANGSWSIPADTAATGNKGYTQFSGSIVFQFKEVPTLSNPITLSNELKIRDKHPAIWIPIGSHQKLLFVKKQ